MTRKSQAHRKAHPDFDLYGTPEDIMNSVPGSPSKCTLANTCSRAVDSDVRVVKIARVTSDGLPESFVQLSWEEDGRLFTAELEPFVRADAYVAANDAVGKAIKRNAKPFELRATNVTSAKRNTRQNNLTGTTPYKLGYRTARNGQPFRVPAHYNIEQAKEYQKGWDGWYRKPTAMRGRRTRAVNKPTRISTV